MKTCILLTIALIASGAFLNVSASIGRFGTNVGSIGSTAQGAAPVIRNGVEKRTFGNNFGGQTISLRENGGPVYYKIYRTNGVQYLTNSYLPGKTVLHPRTGQPTTVAAMWNELDQRFNSPVPL